MLAAAGRIAGDYKPMGASWRESGKGALTLIRALGLTDGGRHRRRLMLSGFMCDELRANPAR